MQHILFATDLSDRSAIAARRARQLQQQFDAALTVLHIVDEDAPRSLAERQKKEAERFLARTFGDEASQSPGEAQKTEIEVETGTPHAAIIEKAHALNVDCIVMGTHRHSVMDAFIGTTVERVLRLGQKPVLIATRDDASAYHRVIVAVDFSVYARRAVRFAGTLAPKGEFFLVHAYDLPFAGWMDISNAQKRTFDQTLDTEMAELATELPQVTKVHREIRIGEPEPTLRETAQENQADLLVLGTHGRTGMARAMLGSVAEAMVGDPPCDVLVVQAW